MWYSHATRAAFTAATILLLSALSSAQDEPMGDVARQARAQKSAAPHATKVLTDENFEPGPVSESDNPVEVVNKAAHALSRDSAHSCIHEFAGANPGESLEILVEFDGPDRLRIVKKSSSDSHAYESIFIGTAAYRSTANGGWSRDPQDAPIPVSQRDRLPEGLANTLSYVSADLKLVRRDVVGNALTFLYENKFHPAGVSNRDGTLDTWIGVNDGLLRKVEMRTSESVASSITPTVSTDTTTCSYGRVPSIKPPM
jgi:hypothetical protein